MFKGVSDFLVFLDGRPIILVTRGHTRSSLIPPSKSMPESALKKVTGL